MRLLYLIILMGSVSLGGASHAPAEIAPVTVPVSDHIRYQLVHIIPQDSLHQDSAKQPLPAPPRETGHAALLAQERDREGIEEEFYDTDYEEDAEYSEELDEIADPLEPVNRFFFNVNDKLYFWLLKPVSQGYAIIVPEPVRTGIKNFFNNIATPVRLVNSLLQLKIRSAGNEVVRFGVNSTLGVLGLFDFARDQMGIEMQDEDFGQTLGTWGVGPVFYINWPVFGPSSVRDTLGFAGDYFLDPVNYVNPTLDRYAIKATDRVNRTSLTIGEYEDLKKDAFDPYTAVKDIYYQYRKEKISQ